MKLKELHGKHVKVKRLWKLHSIFAMFGITFISEKIHQIYNEMSEYGTWYGTEFIIAKMEAEG